MMFIVERIYKDGIEIKLSVCDGAIGLTDEQLDGHLNEVVTSLKNDIKFVKEKQT